MTRVETENTWGRVVSPTNSVSQVTSCLALPRGSQGHTVVTVFLAQAWSGCDEVKGLLPLLLRSGYSSYHVGWVLNIPAAPSLPPPSAAASGPPPESPLGPPAAEYLPHRYSQSSRTWR